MSEPRTKAYTPEELSSVWACPKKLVTDMMRDGRLPHFRVGPRIWRVKPSTVEGKPLDEFLNCAPTIVPLPPIGRLSRSIRSQIGPADEIPPYEFVYFVRCGGFVKVGYSGHPPSRAHALLTGNPYEIELLGFIPGTRVTERILHKAFRRYHHRNEWFRIRPTLLRAIRELCDVAA